MSTRYHREKQRKQGKNIPMTHSRVHSHQGMVGAQGHRPQSPSSQPQSQTASINLKPTDITISRSVEELFPEKVGMFNKLKAKERELDLMINKKLIDLQEHQQAASNGLVDDPSASEILRIYIYNTSENQPWQVEDEAASDPPSWTLRVEGRFLNDREPLESASRKKMSLFLAGVSVEMKAKDGKDDELVIGGVNGGSNSRIVEWHDTFDSNEAERQKQQFDGLDIKRSGSSIPSSEFPENESPEPFEKEIVCNIVIQPKMYPIRLQIIKEALVELVGTNEISQPDCIHKIFNYIKMNNLFETQTIQPQDAQVAVHQPQQVVTVKTDDLLYRIFETNSLTLSQIMEIVSTKLLKPVEPIRLQYSINTLRNTTLGDVIIDLKVNPRLVDPSFKPGAQQISEINQLISESVMNKQLSVDFSKLSENLRLNLQLLNYSKLKYDFYKRLRENPVEFLKKVLQKNSEFLKILSSDSVSFQSDGMIDEEIVRRSDFYTDEFLSEHINILFNSGRI